jgi:hypothetical protein
MPGGETSEAVPGIDPGSRLIPVDASDALPENLRVLFLTWMDIFPKNPKNGGMKMPDQQQRVFVKDLLGMPIEQAEKDLTETIRVNAKRLVRHQDSQFDHGTGRYRPPSTTSAGRKPTAQEQAAELKRQLGIGE